MRGKKLLAAFLLSVGLCFVPALGYGEVETWMNESKATVMDMMLIRLELLYVKKNPTNFLNVSFYYDPDGGRGKIGRFSEDVDTKGKILIHVRDTRDLFSDKPGIAMLEEFKSHLEILFSYVEVVATDMDTDIVAKFYSKGDIPLGYYYQGEYHLWGE